MRRKSILLLLLFLSVQGLYSQEFSLLWGINQLDLGLSRLEQNETQQLKDIESLKIQLENLNKVNLNMSVSIAVLQTQLQESEKQTQTAFQQLQDSNKSLLHYERQSKVLKVALIIAVPVATATGCYITYKIMNDSNR